MSLSGTLTQTVTPRVIEQPFSHSATASPPLTAAKEVSRRLALHTPEVGAAESWRDVLNPILPTACAVVLSGALLSTAGLCAAQPTDDAALSARALVDAGNTARLQRVLAKARRGEPITVGVIGGSITAGAAASSQEKTYGGLVTQWWGHTFPGLEATFVNAGIGATGSNYGALRAQRGLLSKHPDLVIAEYGVNDGNGEQWAETLEGLVRQTLRQPQQPAVMLMFMMNNAGGNAQEWHGKVGAHYHLPMISLRDALWPEIEAGRMKWEDVEADVVHPNDRGHAYAARFVTSFIESVLRTLPPDDQLPAIEPMPEPLISDLFEHVTLFEAPDLQPVSNNGWALDEANGCWKSDSPGSIVEFEVRGRVVLLMDFHLRGPMGKARVQVDDLPPVVREAWFDQTWGGYRETLEIARFAEPGTHRVRVELLEDKNPESEGHEFRIFGLGGAGVEPGPPRM